ncbi:phosphoesterase PA-phosphatase [Micromonospora sp. AMSO12t]|uniref:phosphoesterase PA-phosphatase n=1 Tax=unclassified Micromonospora TaxID=2617518 RepID=UPI00124B883F|nr:MULTISPECIES: phosphoesterase PA-phosphatase [unclassified Micromonospora]KAB1161377.1 phosphoesterase PA-phosphatase [Micromonospora sp. AMSO12t]WSG01001.1 phosphoesterase PA-phosphatase [Micromonospora sp. NBC_01740]
MHDVIDRPDRISRLLARAATEVFAPALLAALMPVVVGLHAASPVEVGLAWALVGSLFCSIIPNSLIWWGVRRGRLTDHHIRRREQRRRPLAYGLLSVLVGLAVMIGFGAPRPVLAMVVVMFALGLAVTVVNLAWKLSIHAAVAAGAAAVLVIEFGPALLASAPVVALVGWSRVRLRDHTVGQVAAGTVVGTLIAAPTFLLLR